MAATSLINTKHALSAVLDTLKGLPTNPPSLYIDLEGVNLSRLGSISIFQLHVLPSRQTYLIDVHTLGSETFNTPSTHGYTLKDTLESGTTPKVIFDVRNDSDALFSHFQIKLQGIHDLQLMQLASSPFRKNYVTGLSKCIELDLGLPYAEVVAWKQIKADGIRLFEPRHGGNYEVFNERPLSEAMKLYCAQDVQYLPRLWAHYNRKLTSKSRKKVESAAKNRVALSQTPGYDPKGPNRALAPNVWD